MTEEEEFEEFVLTGVVTDTVNYDSALTMLGDALKELNDALLETSAEDDIPAS